MKKVEKVAHTVTDLGPGDGGKGGVVHKDATHEKAHTIIKVGGAQGSHGVRTARGQSHNFGQFGCGTFEGIPTYISENMVIEPFSLLDEGTMLRKDSSILRPFDLLTMDGNALCITPFHTAASRLRELARKGKPKGTVGLGCGEAVLDAERYPERAIYAKDLASKDLRRKLEVIRDQKMLELAEIINTVSELWPEDQETAREIIATLNSLRFVDTVVEAFNLVAEYVRIVDQDYLKKHILSRDGVIVVESSHGILTDRYHGFHPHTTRIRTVPCTTWNWLDECGYDGEVVKLGVSRAYQIFHGAGPLVTESSEFRTQLLPGSNKDTNRWQGEVRVGALDTVMMRYALAVAGGPETFNGIAVTWADQIQKVGRWDVCTSYDGISGSRFFSADGNIIVRHGADADQLKYQEELGMFLSQCRPNIVSYDVSGKDQNGVIDLISSVLWDQLHIPVRMMSFGPTELDKVLISK